MDSALQDVLLTLFTLACVAWLLAVAWSAGRGAQVRANGSPQDVVDYAGTDVKVTSRLAVPAGLLALGAGGWLALGRDLSIGSNWYVGTAIGVWVVAFLGSTAGRAPQLAHARRLAVTQGAEDEDVRWRIRQITLTTRGELLLLTVAAVVLVIRPS